MDLNTVWFILVTVLFIGFFFLEGFDYGVGILLPFLGKKRSHPLHREKLKVKVDVIKSSKSNILNTNP